MSLVRVKPFLRKLETGDVEAVCAEEVARLRKESKSLHGVRKALTPYRNALREIDPEHAGLWYLRLDKKESKVLTEKYREQVSTRERSVRTIHNVQGYVSYAETLLRNTSYIDRLLGLAALTGRRTGEILATARFNPISKRKALFTGQLKVKEREGVKPYPIPLLSDIVTINTALLSLQKEHRELWGDPKKAERRTSKSISIRIKHLDFADYLELDRDLIIGRDLRRAYGAIAHALYCEDERITTKRYISDILGHGENDPYTGDSYMDFKAEKPATKKKVVV